MARAQATDFLHGMRFHVVMVSLGGGANTSGFLEGGPNYSATPAGFMSVSTPDIAVAPAMYKEGTWTYERKYPGEPSIGGDIQMERGVARGDSSFWHWIRTVVEGSGEYRADLDIKHYHREQALTRPVNENGDKPNNLKIALDNPARVYHIKEAFPINYQVLNNGLNATDGEVSLMTLQVAYEHFEVEEKTAT